MVVAYLRRDAEIGAQKGRAQFRDKLLPGITLIAEPLRAEVAVKATLVAREVGHRQTERLIMVVVMTTTMVKITAVVEAIGVETSVAITPGPEHKSLESPRPYSLDMIQKNSLILEQYKNLVVIRYGDPFRKTGRIP
jgi:hypothetical protein